MEIISLGRRLIAQKLLDAARVQQAEFWGVLGELEEFLGIEIEGIIDLKDVNLNDLLDPGRRSLILGVRDESTQSHSRIM